MDPLTHAFLPMTAALAVAPRLLRSPAAFATVAFALLPDAGKAVGAGDLTQSLVLLVPLSVVLFGVERAVRGTVVLATLATAFLASHLLLDLLDGGPVTLLYPLVERGVGLHFPAVITFGPEPFAVGIHGPLVSLRGLAVDTERRGYPLVNGFGVASAVLFGTVLAGRRYVEVEPCA